MAKTISDEVMKFSIVVNGNEAQKELFELEKSTRKFNEENKALLLQKKELEKQGKKDTEQYKALTASIKSNSDEIKNNKEKMKVLQDQIGLTGLTMAQLQSKATMLRNILRNLIPGSADYQRYEAELQQVSNRMAQLRGNARETGISLGSLADSFNRYQGIALSVIAALTGMVLSVQKIIDINGKLSDAQSDVMKTTGMTKDEVDALTKSFGLLQTRTSRIDLLGIAEIGGKLGIAKAEIPAFVAVMNKAGVALSDSFTGGAEEAADKLGKIKNLYIELRDAGVEVTFEAVGSALNDLGASGTASEANVAEFVTRVGSMPEVFKPSIAQALGLGAAFEESGIKAEVAGSNYSKVITLAAKNVAGFAAQMGKPKKEIEDLINSNPTEFFLQFANSLKGLSGTQLADVLDKLKLNDNEVKQVLGAASQNTDLFRQKIDLANKSMNEGTSLTNEYNIKNSNLAAILERISKTVSGWFSSETFVAWLTSAVTWLAQFIGAIGDTEGKTTAWKNTLIFTAKIIGVVVAAMVTNVGWLQLCALWTNRNTEANILYTIASKAKAFADGVAMVASQAYAAVTMLMTGNIVGATQAFRVLTATMMTTPWGFLLGAVAAIGTAYVLFSDEAKEAATAQDMMNENMREADGIVQKQSATFMSLIAILQDKTASHDAQNAALEKAKKIGGEYTKGLTLENAATLQGKILIDNYIKSLEKKAMLQVLEKRQAAIMDQIQEKKNLSLEEEVKWYDELWANVKNFGNTGLASSDVVVTASNRRAKALDLLQKQLNFTNTEMAAFLKANPEVIQTIDSPDGGTPPVTPTGGTPTPTKNPNSTAAEINKLKLDEQSKFDELFLKQQRQLQDDKIAIMQDGSAKELAIENQRYKREIDDLNRQKVHSDELAKLDEEIAQAKESKDITKYNALLEIKKGWNAKNLALDSQINGIIEGKQAIHNLRLGTIQEKAAKELIEAEHETYQQQKLNRETAFNNELNALNVSDSEKKRLQEINAKKELELDKQYLTSKLDELNRILAGEVINGIDFSLLSPEAKEKIIKDTELVKNAISKIQNAAPSNEGKKEIDLGIGGNDRDILGFSKDQWQGFFKNIENGTIGVQTMTMALQMATDIFAQLDQFVTASENASLKRTEANAERKKTALKKQLDNGVISQDQYNKRVEKIDLEIDKRKAEIEHKQAKRQRLIAISQIAMNTAMAIMSIWSTGGGTRFADFGISAGVLTGIAAALGAVQIATVLATPLPSASGYEDGLYKDGLIRRQQDGKVFNSKYKGKTRSGLVTDTSHFLVAENGPEMVIDNKAWTRMNPAVKDSLMRDLSGIKGWENGYYNESLKRYEVPATSTPSAMNPSNDNDLLLMVLNVLSESTEVMRDLRENGVSGHFSNKDYQSMKNLKEGLKKYDQLRNNNKQ